MAHEIKQLSTITANNVALRDQYISIAGETIRLPQPPEIATYLARVRNRFDRWADLPGDDNAPLFDPSIPPEQAPDNYLQIDARPLPMRVAEFRDQPTEHDPPAQELLTALSDQRHSVILGEPGSGKSTALERLAWVTATRTLKQIAAGDEQNPRIPILVHLTDYQGEPDLLPLLRRMLSHNGITLATDLAVRATLQAIDADFVLLMDGLNELSRSHRDVGLGAVRRHIQEFGKHTLHLTCRTADFDQVSTTAQLPTPVALWEVQPLTDAIRYWDDDEHESDVRDYLRRHLGDRQGRQLYARLQTDERLHSLARIPLFLFMLKETAGSGEGELPANRGELVQRFVNSDRLLDVVPTEHRDRMVRSLGTLAWQMQAAGELEIAEEKLLTLLADVRGPREYGLEEMRRYLQRTGLLVGLGSERYRLLHQLVQEYGAAAHLIALDDCAEQLSKLAQHEWWRESCILALWLNSDLQQADYLLQLMRDPQIDLRVRVAAGEILGEVGDPRFVRRSYNGVDAIEPQMVTIPAGEAILGGDDPEAYDDEKPECHVRVESFDFAVYPVTNAEFACFVAAKGYADLSLWTTAGQAWLRGESALDPESEAQYRRLYQLLNADVEGVIAQLQESVALSEQDADLYRRLARDTEAHFIDFWARQSQGGQRHTPAWWNDSRYNRPNQPVVGVNWYEAMAYAAWLSRVSGHSYRLPTEAEWEWAARRNRRRYPWGNDWDPMHCNWRGSRLNRANPVGIYVLSMSDEGLHELAGNIFEWTSTLFRGYPYLVADGREEVEAVGRRVLRGGSWYHDQRRVRCASRYWNYPGNRSGNTGFRLARTAL